MNAYQRIWGFILIVSMSMALFGQNDVTSEYRLSSGDQVTVTVFGEEDLAVGQRIDDLGKIMMPLLGEVVLNGFTVREAEDHIEARFRDEDFLVKPEVTVQVTGSRSRTFYVFGEVRSAGMKQFPSNKSRISVIEAISLAGDLTEFAKSTDVLITRRTESGEELNFKVDVRSLIRGNSGELNRDAVEILPGDVIFVPERRI